MPAKSKSQSYVPVWANSPVSRLTGAAIIEVSGARIVAASSQAKALLGYRGKGSPAGRALSQHLPKSWSVKLKSNALALTKGRQPRRLTIVPFTGKPFEAEVSARRLGGTGQHAAVLIAIEKAAVSTDLPKSATVGGAFYRAIVEAHDAAIMVIDARGISHLNPAARTLLDVESDNDIIGRPFAEIVHSDYAPLFDRGLADLKRAARTSTTETIKLKTLLGHVVDASFHAVCLSAPDGERVVVTCRDITGNLVGVEGLMDREQRLQAVVDAVADGVIAVDERGHIQSINASAVGLFAHPPEYYVDRPLAEFLPNWASDSGIVQKVSALGRESIEFPPSLLGATREMPGVARDGHTFPADVTVTIMQRGRGSLFTVVVRDASARKAAEDAGKMYQARLERDVAERTAELRALSQKNRQILAAASNGIVAVDIDGKITAVNPSAGELFDRAPESLIGVSVERLFVHNAGAAGDSVAPIRTVLDRGPYHIDVDGRLTRHDGSSFDAAYTVAPIHEGKVRVGAVITVRDVTERRRMAAEQRVAAIVFDHATEGLLVSDSHGRVTKTNPAFRAITGLDDRRIVGAPMFDTLIADEALRRGLTETLAKDGKGEIEFWREDKSGKRTAFKLGVSRILDDRGRTQQYAAIVSDVTARKLEEEKILYQANYDQLTGLPNRALFQERLQRLVIEGRRAKSNLGLMFIDLDGFKAINDNLGHDAGDLLLQGTAMRLIKCVRESDTVARLGGDEFTVLMPLLDSLDGATLVASRILSSLTQPFDLNGQEGRVSASIGISISPEQARSAEQLLHNADVAMYHAKRQGKANYQIWRQDLESGAEARF